MRIDFDTDDLSEADAKGLVAILAFKFSHLMTSTAPAAIRTHTDQAPVALTAEGSLYTGDEPEHDPRAAFVGEVIEEDEEIPLEPAPAAGAPTNAELAASIAAESVRTSSHTDVERDVDALPWDGRIHAGTKGKNADGRWKRKKAVSDALVASVTAELRGVSGSLAPDAAPPATAPAPPPPPLAPAAIANAQDAALANPTGFTEGRPPGTDFASIMRRITDAQNRGVLTNEQVMTFVTEVGCVKLVDLIKRVEVLPSFAAKIDAQIEMGEAMQAAEGMGG